MTVYITRKAFNNKGFFFIWWRVRDSLKPNNINKTLRKQDKNSKKRVKNNKNKFETKLKHSQNLLTK